MGDYFLGEIRLFPYANGKPPDGWIECSGQLLNIRDYQALYSLLMTTYGGDGKTTFGLPDLRGRAIAGAGAIPDATRILPAGKTLTLGATGGQEGVVLTGEQTPIHNHTIVADTGNATSSLVASASIPATCIKPASVTVGPSPPNLYGVPTVGIHGPFNGPGHQNGGIPGGGPGIGDPVSGVEDVADIHIKGPIGSPPQATNLLALNAASLGNAGAGAAHENRQPFLPMMYCIAVNRAIYPPRDL